MEPLDQPQRLIPMYMEDMIGHGFEEFCQKLFDILQWGDEIKLTKKSKDGGRDIIIRQGRDKIFVECKHWPDNSVGAATIRSLFGATVKEGAKSGICVTTGRGPSREGEGGGRPQARHI